MTVTKRPIPTRQLVEELWSEVEELSKQLDVPAVSILRADRQALVDLPLRGEDCLDPHEVELLLQMDPRLRSGPKFEACARHVSSCELCQELLRVVTPSEEDL